MQHILYKETTTYVTCSISCQFLCNFEQKLILSFCPINFIHFSVPIESFTINYNKLPPFKTLFYHRTKKLVNNSAKKIWNGLVYPQLFPKQSLTQGIYVFPVLIHKRQNHNIVLWLLHRIHIKIEKCLIIQQQQEKDEESEEKVKRTENFRALWYNQDAWARARLTSCVWSTK